MIRLALDDGPPAPDEPGSVAPLTPEITQQLEQLRQEAAAECAMALARIRREAAQALSAELAQLRPDAGEAEILDVRTRAETRLQSDIARVRQEVEQKRAARERALLTPAPAPAPEVASPSVPDKAARDVATEYLRALLDVTRDAASYLRANAPVLGAQLHAGVRSAAALLRRVPPRTAAAVIGVALLVLSAVVLDFGSAAANGLASLTSKMSTMAERASGAISPANETTGESVPAADTPAAEPVAAPAAPRARPRAQRQTSPADSDALTARPEVPANASGLLVVFSRVPLDLFLGGRRLGSTEGGDIVMPPGRHRIQVVSRLLNYQDEIVVDVRPAAVTSFTVSLPDGLIEVDAEPGAEIWIAGERAGVAPLPPQPVALGTREVVARLPDGTERRTSVLVRHGETARAVLDGLNTGTPDPRFPLPRASEFVPRDGR